MKRSRTSAGLVMFRFRKGRLEVLLAHPRGPFFQNKDEGYWTIPKGEAQEGAQSAFFDRLIEALSSAQSQREREARDP